MRRPSLSRRIVAGLLGHMVLLTLAIIGFGYAVHEAAERHAWQAILHAELDEHLRRSRSDPDYRWTDTETLALHESKAGDPTAPFADLPQGVHDEVRRGGREHVVLVREEDSRRLVLSLDIADIEAQEQGLAVLVTASAVALILGLGWGAAWLVGRLVGPLRQLATAIGELRPESSSATLPLAASDTEELAVIVNALNSYLDRHDAFVMRERAFIHSASHELRTPIAVIGGAANLALGQPDLAAETRGQLQRIQRAATHVDRLLPLLLALAKSPEHLLQRADRFDLDELLPEIVDDHRHLLGDKSLQVALAPLPRCLLAAPLNIVQAAIGNLLRNAIENSDSGVIRIALSEEAVVSIEDPGQRMSPEQISALYARHARGQERSGGGIGLALIARLCEHLGWRLAFDAQPGGGTRATLDLGSSLAR